MAVQHRKIGTGIETLCNLPVIKIKAGSIAELNCREAAYLNNSLVLTRPKSGRAAQFNRYRAEASSAYLAG
jgi:hypothetical protein